MVKDRRGVKRTGLTPAGGDTELARILVSAQSQNLFFLLSLLRRFPEIYANKGTENMHRWDKKGSGRGPAALETAPPSRESSRPHLSNHSPAHLHPQVAASRANSPTSYPAARTLVTHWAYCLEPPAPKKGTEGRQKEREVRIKNGRGRPSQRQFGKTSVPSSTPLPNQLTKADPPARRGCSRSRPAPSGGRPGSGARRQRERGGNGRVGWAWLARGRARNKAARLPLPGAGASPGRAARAERAALLRDNGPLPRRRAPGGLWHSNVHVEMKRQLYGVRSFTSWTKITSADFHSKPPCLLNSLASPE
ncbi:hypothetical protein NN561_001696 [Cricetulus griseus]